MNEAKKEFIEKVGMQIEHSGGQRMAGRLLGALLVAEPANQSAEDLAETLQASRGSISTATRYLIQMGLIERVSVAGERKDFYRNKPNAWFELRKRSAEQISYMRDLAKEGLSLLDDATVENRRGLDDMYEFYDFLDQEYLELMNRWKNRKANQ